MAQSAETLGSGATPTLPSASETLIFYFESSRTSNMVPSAVMRSSAASTSKGRPGSLATLNKACPFSSRTSRGCAHSRTSNNYISRLPDSVRQIGFPFRPLGLLAEPDPTACFGGRSPLRQYNLNFTQRADDFFRLVLLEWHLSTLSWS